MALNHGVLSIFILYILFVMVTSIRYTWPGLVAFAVLVAPYTTILQLMHTQVVFISTANPSNLAYNNNTYLSNDYDNYEEARLKIIDEVDHIAKNGAIKHYPRPFLIPPSKYADWNMWENKRRIYLVQALEYMRSDIAGAPTRAYFRIWNILRVPGCGVAIVAIYLECLTGSSTLSFQLAR